MTPRRGSAAVAKAMPQSAKAALDRCMARLTHGLALARIARGGPEPEYAARYLLDALKAVRRDARALRSAARSAV